MVTRNYIKYNGIFDCFYWILKEEGLLSLYRGTGLNVIKYGSNQALLFTFNNFF